MDVMFLYHVLGSSLIGATDISGMTINYLMLVLNHLTENSDFRLVVA